MIDQEQQKKNAERLPKENIVAEEVNNKAMLTIEEPPKENVSMQRDKKKTKETMKHEPLPIFDCVFCVSDYKLVFQKISETNLSKKYSTK